MTPLQRSVPVLRHWAGTWLRTHSSAILRPLFCSSRPLHATPSHNFLPGNDPEKFDYKTYKKTKFADQLAEMKKLKEERKKLEGDNTTTDIVLKDDETALAELKKLENRVAVEKYFNESPAIQQEIKASRLWSNILKCVGALYVIATSWKLYERYQRSYDNKEPQEIERNSVD